jgi:transcriptional regulator with XRE-family HTH domain
MARPRNVHGGGTSKGAGTSARQSVAAEIRKARLAAGLTQRELASRLKRSPAWIGAAEKGHRRIYLHDLPRIAQALGMDAIELVTRAMSAERRQRKP